MASPEAETETCAAGTQPASDEGVDGDESSKSHAVQAEQASSSSSRSSPLTPEAGDRNNSLLQHSSDSLHAHRQNHTASKLPAFRFADVRESLALPGLGLLQNQHPVSSCAGPGSAGTTGVTSRTQVASLSAVETAHHHQGHPQNTTLNPENSSQRPQWPLRASAHTPEPASPALLTPVTEADESQSTTTTTVIVADADAPDLDLEPETEPEPAPAPILASNYRQDNAPEDSPHSITSPDGQSPRSRASTYETASTSAPITPTTAKRSASASSRIDNAIAATAGAPDDSTTPAAASQSPADTDSSRFYTPATRPGARRANSSRHSASTLSPLASRAVKDAPSPGTATKQWAHGQRELVLPKPVNGTPSDDDEKVPRRQSSTSRPPSSYKPPRSLSTFGRIPPIRSFRSSGSRRSSLPDMNNSSSRYYDDDGEDYRDLNQRDRSLRALEGVRTPPDADDENAESENNTADIFMRIAREDSSSSIPRRGTDRGAEDDPYGTDVSPVLRPKLIIFPGRGGCTCRTKRLRLRVPTSSVPTLRPWKDDAWRS